LTNVSRQDYSGLPGSSSLYGLINVRIITVESQKSSEAWLRMIYFLVYAA
jgi:hypothetical protein